MSGGVEQRRLLLARHLPADRFEQRLFCLNARGALAQELEDAGVEVSVAGARHLRPKALASLARLVARYRPEIVHGAVFEGSTMAVIAGRASGAPVVIVEETSDSTLRSARGQLAMRALAGAAHACVAVSPTVGRTLQTHTGVPASKITVIPNGVRTPRALRAGEMNALRAWLALPPDLPVIGTVARLFEDKGVHLIVEAIAALKGDGNHAALVVVGDGPARAALERAVTQAGLSERVRFVGYQADVAPFYGLMDLFVLPSRHESFGLVFVEAMHRAIPVVATRVGGIPDVVLDGETGLLVARDDAQALRRAIGALLSDRERRRAMGEAGQARARRAFSAERYARDVATLYQSLCAAHRAPGR